MIGPQKLFLMDAIGALVSFVMLGFVLVTLQNHIGMPIPVLQYLAIAAFIFSLFSIANYYFPSVYSKKNLRVIAILNAVYALVTAILIITHWTDIKPLGLMYFSAEITILIFLARLELKVANSSSTF